MKKFTLLLAFFIATFSQAQIADGSVAPDFTVQDINGNTHSLSAYLAAGKTVIIDISATWCSPCWAYHNAKVLDDIYHAYGDGGSEEVVVLFVEGDPSTTLADLNGTGNNTQGDWVTGSEYPVIDSGEIADLYQIAYFPTVFRICPTGIVTEIGTGNASSIRSGINANCGTLVGEQNHAHAIENVNRFCSASGAPVAKIRNYGENGISTATLELKENGTTIATKNWAGSCNRFVTRNIPFDNITMNPNAEYTFKLVNVNGSPLFTSNYDTADLGVNIAGQAGLEVEVHIKTDNWPTEITWELRNSANVVVASGGPYEGNANNGGGAQANTTIIENATLVPGQCYSARLLDSYGDGWSLGPTEHGMEIFSNGTSIFNYPTSNFGTSLTVAAVASTSALNVDQNEVAAFKIYPNPTTGLLNISSESAVDVTVTDMLGKVVFSSTNVSANGQIDLSNLQKGLYVATVSGLQGTVVEKVVLK